MLSMEPDLCKEYCAELLLVLLLLLIPQCFVNIVHCQLLKEETMSHFHLNSCKNHIYKTDLYQGLHEMLKR